MVKDERALLQAEEALFVLLPKNVVHPFTGKGLLGFKIMSENGKLLL
jgi:hypothetical protein